MIYDLILLAIFITFIIIGVVRGAAKALIGIVVSFVSYLLASMLAKMISIWIYTSFISPAIHQAVTDAINGIASGASGTTSDMISAMPQWLVFALNLSDCDVSGLITTMGYGMADQAGAAIDAAVQPVMVGFLSLLLTIGLYLLIHFLLHLLAVRPILKMFDLPGISAVNRVFGGILGFIEAFVIVSMLAYLLRLILPQIHSGVSFLNESTIYNSFIFYYFYSGNIFAVLTGWIKI